MPSLPTNKKVTTEPAHNQLCDLELAQRIAGQDTTALELLMRRYNQLLYRAARSILKNEQEAEEAVQDAYLKAFHAMNSFRAEAKLATWLTRIVVNESLMRLRKQKRRGDSVHIGNDFFDYQSESVATQESDSMPMPTYISPERAAQNSDMRRLIEHNIDQLPDAFRSVFVLRAVEEMSVEETAQCLDIPEATVRTRYFRARNLLRAALAREFDHQYEEAFGFAGARCNRIVANVLARVQAEQKK